MPEVLFRSGKPAYLQLKVGAGATMNLKIIGGTGYTIGDNDVNEDLGAGSMTAAPKNMNTGLFTPRLDVIARLFAPSGGAGWWSAANVQSLFGPAAATPTDLSTRASLNGDIPMVDVLYSNGVDSVTDQMKLATLALEAAAASNDVVCRMTFLGLNAPSAATFGAFVDAIGRPIYWKNVQMNTWTPAGGAGVDAPGVERYALGISTGLAYAKFADGTDNPSALDPAATLAGGVSIVQRSNPDATAINKRLMNAKNGTLIARIGGVEILTGMNRQGASFVANPSGAVVDRTAWQLAWVDGAFLKVAVAT